MKNQKSYRIDLCLVDASTDNYEDGVQESFAYIMSFLSKGLTISQNDTYHHSSGITSITVVGSLNDISECIYDAMNNCNALSKDEFAKQVGTKEDVIKNILENVIEYQK